MFDMFQIQFDPTGEDRIKVRVAFLWPQYRTKTPYANADFLNSHMAVYIEIYIEIYCKTSDVISTSFDSFWLGLREWANREQFRYDETRIILLCHAY